MSERIKNDFKLPQFNISLCILYTGNTNKLPQNNPFALQHQLRQSSSHSECQQSIN